MALQIGTNCIACYACETVCLAGAISIDNNTFVINPALCNECADLDTPRCIAICPEAGVITYPHPKSARTTCTEMLGIKLKSSID